MKDLLLRFAIRLPDGMWGRSESEACLLPYYHMVSDVVVPHVSPLYQFRTVAEFQADLDYLLQGRRALSLGEFIDTLRETGTPPKNSFLLTFDDGFREMHDVVMPLLAARRVPAIFFLNTATLDNRELGHHQKISLLLWQRNCLGPRFPDGEVLRRLAAVGIGNLDPAAALKSIPWRLRETVDELAALCELDFEEYLRRHQPYVTSDEVRTMRQNRLEIGAHSVDHPLYSEIPLIEQLRQTRQSMETLVERFGLPHRAFAFPHTDRGVSREFFDTVFNERSVEITFGTAAPARDEMKFSIQRFSMEKSRLPARAIVVRNRIRSLRLRASGATVLKRPQSS
jgi:peptidoglycan/xylan/chitin deacetylase (PgdA/CDA1 family)